MKFYPVRLLQTAMIAGKPRSPAEGIQMVSQEERDRLIAARQAEDAEADVDRKDDDGGDGLDGKTVKDLRALAKTEGATIEGDANKATILTAIRDRRALFDGSGIDVGPDDGLRTLAGKEGFTVADDADTAALIAAIRDGRAAKA